MKEAVVLVKRSRNYQVVSLSESLGVEGMPQTEIETWFIETYRRLAELGDLLLSETTDGDGK